MTDMLRIAHLRIAHQVANPEVGNSEGIPVKLSTSELPTSGLKTK